MSSSSNLGPSRQRQRPSAESDAYGAAFFFLISDYTVTAKSSFPPSESLSSILIARLDVATHCCLQYLEIKRQVEAQGGTNWAFPLSAFETVRRVTLSDELEVEEGESEDGGSTSEGEEIGEHFF
eukprot:g15062.t1